MTFIAYEVYYEICDIRYDIYIYIYIIIYIYIYIYIYDM